MRPSAKGRNASVAAAWPAPRPPIPGVSTTTSPCLSSGLGTLISTRSTLRSFRGLPTSLTHSLSWSMATASLTAVPSSRLRLTVATASSPKRTSVIADVARSSSTGQIA